MGLEVRKTNRPRSFNELRNKTKKMENSHEIYEILDIFKLAIFTRTIIDFNGHKLWSL